MKERKALTILSIVVLITLIIFRFSIFGFGVAIFEFLFFAGGLVGVDKQKADAYLAHKYDEEVKDK